MRGPDQTEHERKASNALEEVAGKAGANSIRLVTQAYVMRKTWNVFPLIGGLTYIFEALDMCLNMKRMFAEY